MVGFSEPRWVGRYSLVFATALVLRLAFLGVAFWRGGGLDALDSADAYQYDRIAINLLEGNGYSLQAGPPYEPDMFRTPLYPVTLASVYWLIGRAPYAVAILQCVIGSLTCLLTARLARLLTSSRRVGALAGLLVAVYPLSVLYDNCLLTESLFTFLLLLALLLFATGLRSEGGLRFWLCGLALGLSALCKPIGLYVVGILSLHLILAPRSWGGGRLGLRPRLVFTACMCLSLCAVVSPWFARNRLAMGNAGFSTISGPDALWMRPLALVRSVGSGRSPGEELNDAMEEFKALANLPTGELSYRRKAIDEILGSNPPYWRLHLWGMLISLLSPQSSVTGRVLGLDVTHVDMIRLYGTGGLVPAVSAAFQAKGPYETTYVVFMVIVTAGILALAVRSLFHLRRSMISVSLALVAVYLITVPGAIGDGRYRVPAMPIFAVLAVAGTARGRDLSRDLRSDRPHGIHTEGAVG